VNLALDTHVFLWWDRQDLIADPANQVFVSAASILEIIMKRRLKNLDFHGSAVAAIGANGFHGLAILPIDAENAGTLTWRHSDPFDRMLVAQARHPTCTSGTVDVTIRAVPNVAQMWAG